MCAAGKGGGAGDSGGPPGGVKVIRPRFGKVGNRDLHATTWRWGNRGSLILDETGGLLPCPTTLASLVTRPALRSRRRHARDREIGIDGSLLGFGVHGADKEGDRLGEQRLAIARRE